MRSRNRRRTGVSVMALAALASLAGPARGAPAWWRVSDGHAQLWVLGAPRLTPRGLAWDTSAVERRLAGASRLIFDVQPLDGLKAVAILIARARTAQPMEEGLPPALRRRFETQSAVIGKDPRRYAGWKPAVAGVMLAGDVYRASELKPGEVDKVVRDLARKAAVPETPAGCYDASDRAAAAETLSQDGQQVCLSATLQGLEAGPARLKAEAMDWAQGDPRPALPTAADLACLSQMPAPKALSERNLAIEADALAEALKAPGRSVAVLDLQQLVMPQGVFDRLRAQGLSVSGPLP